MVAVVLLSVSLLFARWAWVPPVVDGLDCALPQNGAWLGVEWVSQPVDRDRVAELAVRAEAMRLRVLFPYVTYVKSDSTFNPTYDYAGAFVSAFHRNNDETKLLAWIGVPLVNDRVLGIDGWVDLSDPDARRSIAELAAWMVREVGFDGVHLNVETIKDGNPAYLQLLDEVRAALGPGPILSVAASYWIPGVASELPVVNGYRWRGAYYRAVAARVDQMAVMTYDSGMVHPALYRLWLREQVKAITRAITDTDIELLIGLSVSHERSLTHHPYAENLQSGLAGLCASVARSARPVNGAAIYAAWEMDEIDWQHWADWLSGD
jgi:hypothetical protein